MSFDGYDAPMMATDKKRRMSLKGPPLRVAVKSTASAQEAPKPRTAIPQSSSISAPQPRPSLAGSSMSDRRLSISARAHAKASAPKPTIAPSAAPSPVVTRQVAVDPFAIVNARLDSIERQISDMQVVLSKISALEDLVRPLKVTVTTLEGDVAELSSTVKRLSDKPSASSRGVVEHPYNMVETAPEQTEFVEDVLNELDQSLDSGEIDLAEYGHSLRYVLGKDARIVGAAPMMSTPVSQKKPAAPTAFHIPATYSLPADTPSKLRHASTTVTAAPASRPRVQHERTPIKRNMSTSAAPPSFSKTTIVTHVTPQRTPQRTPRAAVTVSTPAREAENLKNLRLNAPAFDSKRAAPAPVSCVQDYPKIIMESIKAEEKVNVQFWLGLDLGELNRAVTLLNDLVLTRQSSPDFDPSTSKEVALTLEDVSSQCLVEVKKANAIILLLCGLKRLKITRRGESKHYTVLSGNSIKA